MWDGPVLALAGAMHSVLCATWACRSLPRLPTVGVLQHADSASFAAQRMQVLELHAADAGGKLQGGQSTMHHRCIAVSCTHALACQLVE